MRCSDLHLLGAGAALGRLVPVTELLDANCNDRTLVADGQRAISIARDTSGPELAIRAANDALAIASLTGLGPLPVPDLHLHAAIWRGGKGVDFWSAASYVRRRLGLSAGRGLVSDVNAMSNSMLAGLELASSVLTGRPDLDTALLTGGDIFGAPAFPHLTADIGITYGDGGSSLLLGRRPGLAKLRSISSYADASLEGLHRGETPFRPAGGLEIGAINVRARKRAYLRHYDVESVHRRNTLGVTEATKTALSDAGVTLDDMRWVLIPHYGHTLQDTQCLQPLALGRERSLRHVGDQWGHLGAHDQIAGLVHLFTRGAVHPGDHLLLLGIGVGMTWTAAVIEIEQVPNELSAFAPPLLWPWRSEQTERGRNKNLPAIAFASGEAR